MDRKNSLRRRGSSLAITLVLVSITALALTALADTVVSMQRINKRKADLSRAYYAAEGGVALIQHFSNFPAQFQRNPALFVSYNGTTGPTIFPLLNITLNLGNYNITEYELTHMGFPPLRSDDGRDISAIKQITLIKADPVNDPVPCFFKVRSVGYTKSGLERTVVSYMDANIKLLKIVVPAGLISYNLASAGGNAKIHWGQSWSKNTFTMLNKTQMDYTMTDPWAQYRTESSIDFPPNWNQGNPPDIVTTQHRPGALPGASGNYDIFEQNVAPGDLQWPEFDYQTFKDQAMAHGRYYTTDAAGNIYKNGTTRVDFYTEFTVKDRATSPYDLIFIDTINRQPPAADGSNLATIRISGSGRGTKGVMYIAANVDASGIGTPPSMFARDRNGNVRYLEKIFHDGVIYSSGTIAMAGNAGVYGAVVAQRGFIGGGTPDIYYNGELANGLDVQQGNIGSKLKVLLTKNY